MGIFSNLFGSKKKQKALMQARQSILQRLNDLKLTLFKKRLLDAKSEIQQLEALLDNPNLNLSQEQLDAICEQLDFIEIHIEPEYDDLLKTKCEKIVKIVKFGYQAEETKQERNAEKISEIQAKLKALAIKDNQLSAEMEKAVKDNDRAAYNKARLQLNTVRNNYKILNQAYLSLLNQNSNLDAAEVVQEARIIADDIEMQNVDFDISQIKANVESSKSTNDYVANVSKQIVDIIDENTILEDGFDTAREAYSLSTKNDNDLDLTSSKKE